MQRPTPSSPWRRLPCAAVLVGLASVALGPSPARAEETGETCGSAPDGDCAGSPPAEGDSASWLERVARYRPIATDRPGNGNAATTVPRLRLQLETSAVYGLDRRENDPGGDAHLVAFITALRFGATDWLELRVVSALVGIEARSAADTTVHASDTALGLKVTLLPGEGAVPDLAVMADTFFPTGSGFLTTDTVVPEVRAAAAWSLPAGFGLLLNAGFEVLDDEAQGRFARLLYVVNVSWTFPPSITDRVSVFVEAFGFEAFRASLPDVRQFDAGLAFLVTDDLQLDVFSQHSFTEARPDHQLSLGFSARF